MRAGATLPPAMPWWLRIAAGGANPRELDPFRYDVEDGFDTQQWTGQQPWCNGQIGTAGGSYVGWTQWAAAPNASRYLKAMVPVVPFDNAYEVAYPGGAFQLRAALGLGRWGGASPSTAGNSSGPTAICPWQSLGDQFEKPVGYLDDWIKHCQYDDYWKARAAPISATRG